MLAYIPFALTAKPSVSMRPLCKNSKTTPLSILINKNIILALEKIVAVGAFERFFRPEGKMSDRVAALSIDSRKLRLYCLRISDQILIVGNGGKKDTRTYEESSELSGYVMDLQEFDKLLSEAQKDGSITIEKNVITGIEGKVFQLS